MYQLRLPGDCNFFPLKCSANVTIKKKDNCLTFKDHIDILCSNASHKLHVLRRIRKYLTPDEANILYKAFINSQFSYASDLDVLQKGGLFKNGEDSSKPKNANFNTYLFAVFVLKMLKRK